MEGLVWLMILCALTAGILLVLGLCRRMTAYELPETRFLWVVLDSETDLPIRLEALLAHLTWTDRTLIPVIWLADATPDGRLAEICIAFCRAHPAFQYCRLSELVKISEKTREPKKNDCNSSKKHV